MILRTYSVLSRIKTFESRFEYLKLKGEVGVATFGFDRYMNQRFYTSRDWKRVRNSVILRDNGCDLGIEGREIFDKIVIHHMNPLVQADLINMTNVVLEPEFLVCTTLQTHNAIHYGDKNQLIPLDFEDRKPGDTTLWPRRTV